MEWHFPFDNVSHFFFLCEKENGRFFHFDKYGRTFVIVGEKKKNKERRLQDLMGNHYLNGFALTSITEKGRRFYRSFLMGGGKFFKNEKYIKDLYKNKNFLVY